MVAMNFKPEFSIAIDAGEKRRTIRRVRKSNNPKPGCALELFTGFRTKACEKIKDAKCTRVRPIEISHMGIKLDGRTLWTGDAPAYQGGPDPEHYEGDFCRADGFDSFTELAAFFEAQYGLPFTGQLIEWA